VEKFDHSYEIKAGDGMKILNRTLKTGRGLVILAVFLALSGCAEITLTTACPATSTGVGFALAGSTIGNTALSMLSTGLAGAGGLAAKAGTTAPATTATMSYKYLAIWGPDSGSLSCTSPPQSTVVVASPPASIVK